jgi:hypothetical protein
MLDAAYLAQKWVPRDSAGPTDDCDSLEGDYAVAGFRSRPNESQYQSGESV